ncbi:patched domain-containing protein 3 [Patella vulgata]|uniref:patched domain-containing protein 3 n=1 Tax=Patella vulgata TaxID=6465 RepID=UPI00217F5CFA|nr:patched domain-containing protein 3 [Patella vulgata]
MDRNQTDSNITTETPTMPSSTAPEIKDKIDNGKCQDEDSDATSTKSELDNGESKDKVPDTKNGKDINTNLGNSSDNQSKSNMTTQTPTMSPSTAPEGKDLNTNNKVHNGKCQDEDSDVTSTKSELDNGESKDKVPDTKNGKDINTNLGNSSDNQSKSNMTTQTPTMSPITAPEGKDLNTNNKVHNGKRQDEEFGATSTKKETNSESKDKDTKKRKNANLRNCSDNYMEKVGMLFGRYGKFVATYPFLFIITPLIVCGLLGVGLLNMSSESDIETLYVPINSPTASDRTKVNSLFPDKSDSNFYEHSLGLMNLYGDIIIKSRDNRDVLSLEVVDEIRNITSQLKQFSFEDGGLNFTYTDVCAVRDGACFINGEFILADYFIRLYQGGNISYPKWTDPQGIPTDLSLSIKGSVNTSMVLKSVSTLYLKFHLRQKNISRSQKWETEFLDFISKMSTNLTDIAYSVSSSLDQELNSNTGQDIFWFSISFTLLITYASVVAAGGNCVSNRSHLARAGVIGVALAILASFGILSAGGVKFVNIVGVMPFLALGVGVDSMFVIMSEWTEHHHKATTEDQMEAALKGCGGSITIASLTDVTAFLIGASSQFISIRNFCIYTGLALAISYFCHMTFFIGCLALQGRRVRDNRHCVTCRKTEDKATMKMAKKNLVIVELCSGKMADKREDDESVFEKLPRICLTKTILQKVTKALVIFVFLIYLGLSIWGVLNLKQGLILSNLISDTSYFNKYESWRSSEFETKFSISFTFENIDYLNEAQVNSMRNFMESVQHESIVENNSLLCWYHQYVVSNNFSNVSKIQFISNLKAFLTHRPYISNDIEFTSDGSAVKASRCYVFTVNLPDSTDQGNLMLRMRELADGSELDVFAYTPPFIFFEQYVVILPNTIQTVGIAVVCMLVITIIFMPHPIMVVLVTLNMISILVGIFGFLYFWDLTLSSITMIHLIMSVGFSVDFSVHVCHGFMSSDKDNKDDMARDALKTSAAPVINGGLSSLIGICTLAGSQSYVFRSFFKIMVLVISFGLAHSMLLLPVILSLIGPANDCNNKVGLLASQTEDKDISLKSTKPNLTPTTEIHDSKNLSVNPTTVAKEQGCVNEEKPNIATLTPTESIIPNITSTTEIQVSTKL